VRACVWARDTGWGEDWGPGVGELSGAVWEREWTRDGVMA
jgi:hypothetical protein